MSYRSKLLSLIEDTSNDRARRHANITLKNLFRKDFKSRQDKDDLNTALGKTSSSKSKTKSSSNLKIQKLTPEQFMGEVVPPQRGLQDVAAVKETNAEEELVELASMGFKGVMEQFGSFKKFRGYLKEKHNVTLPSGIKNKDAYEVFAVMQGYQSEEEE